MYVVPVASFLSMDEALPHQVLRARHQLLDFDAIDGLIAAFVSHQWCAPRHADPSFKQLRMMQSVFRRAAQGTLQVNLDLFTTFIYHLKPTVQAADLRGVLSWTMWYDYFSVPQPEAAKSESSQHTNLGEDLGKAVASLATYVQKCAYFFILTPWVQHQDGHHIDYGSWRSRGWCRLERMARLLSPGATSLLLVQRADIVFEVGPDEYLFDPVARGCFGQEEDRAELGPLVRRLLEGKLAALLASGRMAEYRKMASWCPLLLAGFPCEWRRVRTGFADMLEPDPGLCHLDVMHLPRSTVGPTGVLLAAACGDVPAVRSLLSRHASLECTETEHCVKYFRFAGQTPLHVAAASGHAAMVAFLLERRADVGAGDRYGHSPLHMAAYVGCADTAQLLLDHRADADAKTHTGGEVLTVATCLRRIDFIRCLLESGCYVETRPGKVNALHAAAIFGAGIDIVRLLLEGRISPHSRMRPRGRALRLALSVFSAAHRLGKRGFFCAFARHFFGSTALHMAAMLGHWGEARALLDAHADPNARNDAGVTAREVAVVFGTAEDALHDL